MSDALAFMAATQRMQLLVAWLWWPPGLAFMNPTGLQQGKKQFLTNYCPMAQHRESRHKHSSPSLSLKEV